MVTLIPPRMHYICSTITSSTPHMIRKLKNTVNIIVPEEYHQPEKILLTVARRDETVL